MITVLAVLLSGPIGGLFSRLLISVFLMPALYAMVARPGDRLEV
jgi:cobalt-zinc-cadmium resistance protein CzcA